MSLRILLILFCPLFLCAAKVELGIDCLFTSPEAKQLKGKRVGLITNHTGVDANLRTTEEIFKEKTKLCALFSPEHGAHGAQRAGAKIENAQDTKTIPHFSLHGETRRPTEEMLKNIDVLVFDIQEIGCRSYTYASTLFLAMEEAAKKKIPLIVLDRPNPLGGLLVDGPMLEERWRSFLGYVNVPYCHGLTIGELALYFNQEYKVGCDLHVVKMQGWKREMTFAETGLSWMPTSPYIPEPDTPLFYASTGILGALGVVNIGIGYTMPFKVIGAPWIDPQSLANALNQQKLPGVQFHPFHYTPFYGKFKEQLCHGVKIVITDQSKYRPLSVQYLLIGVLKSLYPKQFEEKLKQFTQADETSFCKINGNQTCFDLVKNEKYIAWKLIGHDKKEREAFEKKRLAYLLY